MLKIKIKYVDKTLPKLEIIKKGDWIDLYSSKELTITSPKSSKSGVMFKSYYIPLNICMKLPKGYEAHVLPRSSTFKNYGILLANSQGIIDNTYSGNNDQWCFPALFVKDAEIKVGDRIAQFRICLSQKATIWQKIKWLFTNKIKFVEVDNLDDEDRGGFGSTGK